MNRTTSVGNINLPLAPPPQQDGAQMEVIHPSIAAKVKREALGKESMTPLRERGIEPDQTISRAGIKALLKKTPEEMSSRRLANFLSIFPGKMGRSEWSGSSHLQDIKKLADKYQELPSHALHEKMEVLEQLATALDNYGSQATKARLGDRIAGLKEFVRGEMLNLKAQQHDPGLQDLGPGLYGPRGLLSDTYEPFLLAVEMGDQEALNGIVSDMTNRIVVVLQEQGVDGEKFAASSGARLKEQLLNVIFASQPRSGEVMNGGDHTWDMVEKAMDQLYSGVTNGLNEGHGRVRTDGTLAVEETRYVPQGGVGAKDVHVSAGGASLDEGGFGSVFIYDGTDGSKIVVKEQLDEGVSQMVGDQKFGKLQEKAHDSHHEASIHRLAQGEEGHENLVRLVGTMHNGKNTTICLEYCPNGSVPGMGRKLWDSEMLSGLSPDQQSHARRQAIGLMSRDMARGLNHMHQNGVGHQDFKGANVFLGRDGVAKVGDLGSSVKLQEGRFEVPTNYHFPDAPAYLAPEVLELTSLPPHRSLVRAFMDKEWIASFDLDKFEEAYAQIGHPGPQEVFQRIKGTLQDIQQRAGEEGSDKDTLVQEWNTAVRSLESMVAGIRKSEGITTGQVVDVTKVDVWALGITMCELAYSGDHGSGSPFEGSNSGRTAANITGYALDGTKTFTQYRLEKWAQQHPDILPPTDERLDALLDKLLHHDPDQRISLDQALEDPYFQELALDNPQVRDFVQKLTSSGSSKVEIEESAKLVGAL
ncbi:protein kinase [Verrucomicrobium sp. BvORR034]|uniref:protein kinase domain-containing protein n=1 Tax=Verrucomicrobium sp. BvORR034 TaxID=1396418 RepID=UPI0006798E07|nr:protein kinase [Verrucomicrobium sp. BvORR034]